MHVPTSVYASPEPLSTPKGLLHHVRLALQQAHWPPGQVRPTISNCDPHRRWNDRLGSRQPGFFGQRGIRCADFPVGNLASGKSSQPAACAWFAPRVRGFQQLDLSAA